MNESETTTVRSAASFGPDHPVTSAIAGRSDIFAMTEQAHDAALTPDDPGDLSHAERAALACRMARLNAEHGSAEHFSELLGQFASEEMGTRIADPDFNGGSDVRLSALIRHTDLVTKDTKSVTAEDIAALKNAGVSENDIVRLSELIAFVNYQTRVVTGLRLMARLA